METSNAIWYMTKPQLCPYLPERQERRIFARMSETSAPMLDSALAHAGFRRSRDIFYRPFCAGCSACVSVRVLTEQFSPSRSCQRILRRNQDVYVNVLPPKTNLEQFQLLRTYLCQRHNDSKMSDMTLEDYTSMVEETHVNTKLLEYRLDSGKLLAVSLTDVLSDGLSMLYSFFDPNSPRRGLGNFMILDHIQRTLSLSLDYVYLGYWIKGCSKMSYKIRFRPVEILHRDGWCRVAH